MVSALLKRLLIYFIYFFPFLYPASQAGANGAAGGNPEEDDEEAEMWEQLRLAEQEAAAQAERRAARVCIGVL